MEANFSGWTAQFARTRTYTGFCTDCLHRAIAVGYCRLMEFAETLKVKGKPILAEPVENQ
jgi:hypothetical protein